MEPSVKQKKTQEGEQEKKFIEILIRNNTDEHAIIMRKKKMDNEHYDDYHQDQKSKEE